MESTAVEAVRKSVVVNAPITRAFEVFTSEIGDWWPASHHIGKQPYKTAVLEQRVDGRWFERAIDGSECDWGRVLAWEPPLRVLLAWGIGPDWQFEPDMEKASEVEVRFIQESPESTRVELQHRKIERHGAGAESMRSSVDAQGGWQGVLELFRKGVEDRRRA